MSSHKGNPRYSDDDVATDPITGCQVRKGCRHKNGYVKRRINLRYVYAHVAAWEKVNGPVPNGFELDHKCRNRACENVDHLRVATDSQNQGNRGPTPGGSSRFKGVSRALKGKPWRAAIGGKYLGQFQVEEDAARVYDAAAVAKWGDFAWTNFPREGEPAA